MYLYQMKPVNPHLFVLGRRARKLTTRKKVDGSFYMTGIYHLP